MSPQTRKVLNFIFKTITDKSSLFFWFFVRFISAILPLITIYQFSHIIKLVEQKQTLNIIFTEVIFIFVVRILDNYLRLLSITHIRNAISNISFDIHNFFLSDLKTSTKEERHAAVQAVRNFSDASSITLDLVNQPGVDSIVSLIFIPIALFFIDFPSCVMTLAYIIIYIFIDHYTTQHYVHLKDIQNTKTENYYAKLQETNDYDLEQIAFSRHYKRLCQWEFTEWFSLQNTAVIFYTLLLIYLTSSNVNGSKDISDLILITGYISQTQVLLNSFSSIKDSLSDALVGLEHLAKNESVSTITLDDLV